MNTPLETEIAKRFGVLPNFFRLASSDPKIATNLWGFAQFAYLDNPLPSLFKERLFVYLSRFCEVRYCIARHVGFLVGLGNPAGDSTCLPQTVESILPLLLRPLPHAEELLPLYAVCAGIDKFVVACSVPDSPEESALFACAAHVFLQTPDAITALEALRGALGARNLEQLNLVLTFVRTAHYWTKLHPELAIEDDITQLLATHEKLAECILNDPDGRNNSLSRHVVADLVSLRQLRKQHETMTRAYQELTVDHQSVKHTLNQTEENLRELISSMPAAVYACDRAGFLTYFNRQAIEIWGRTPDSNDTPWSFLDLRRMYRNDGTLLRPKEAPVKSVLTSGVSVINSELVLERPDLSRINVLANITALRDSTGEIAGAVSIFQDVTELKRIQQERDSLLNELERSNRELSQFSYAVSHDLKAPVNHVRSLTQLFLQREPNLKQDSAHLLTMIDGAATRMEHLIESLLQYAQAGQGELNLQPVQMDSIIESIRGTLEPLISKTRAEIICKPFSVEADPVLLEQLIQNLVANAIQYHRPEASPVVEISGEAAGEVWQFAVKDNGQGIPPDYQAGIFEPFKRLHGRETPGTGLGLALCRAIVGRHGGRIWVESDESGHGATFRFTLGSKSHVQSATSQPQISSATQSS